MYEIDNPMIKSEPGVLSGAGGAEAQERALSPPCTSPCTPFPDFSPFPPGLPATAADPDFCLSGVSAADNMWPDAYEPLQLSRPPEPTIEVESAAWEASQTAASLVRAGDSLNNLILLAVVFIIHGRIATHGGSLHKP